MSIESRRPALWLGACWVALVISGCAGMGEIEPDDTAGTIAMLGFSTEGRPVGELGFYYLLQFVSDAGDEQEVVLRPRKTDDYQIITGLPAGKWTLDTFAARRQPGVSGFDSASMRRQPVQLEFELQPDTAHPLSWQLQVRHGEGRNGLTTSTPEFVPLQTDVREQIERRLAAIGDSWHVQAEPVGQRPEDDDAVPERPGVFERLLGD